MKANAPEKIYLSPITLEEVKNVITIPTDSRDIEYTRTDAFIEKAKLFFIDNLNVIPMGSGKMKIKAECSLEEFIEQFKNCMKGGKDER